MKRLLTLCLLALSVNAMAQSQSRIVCGNELLENKMEQRVPGYKAAVKYSFDQARQHRAQRSVETYTIPVVFHIVYDSIQENLDDSVILSQMQVLNDDYSRLNADTGNTISYFDSVAADTHIRFSLQGIQRVQTTNAFVPDLFFGLPDSLIKFSAAGGDDAVDPDHTLNIWVVNMRASLFGQILGYSYPPDSMSNWDAGSSAAQKPYDGVVLDYRTVGANNPNPLISDGSYMPVYGRTATHEVGHFLGLRHIWGDGGSIFGGGNDCAQSDGIDDTPFASERSDFDCSTGRNTCPGIDAYYGANAPDMVQNYMDYSAETCMNLFTKGQAALMQGTLEHQRRELAVRSAPTAIAQIGVAQDVTIHPNPTSGIVYLQYSETANPYSGIQVYNMLSALVSVPTTTVAGAVRLDMSGLPTGVYTLDIAKDAVHIARRVVLSR